MRNWSNFSKIYHHNSMKSYRLLVLDWDGTVVNSHARIIQAFKETIRQMQLPARNAEQIEAIIGLGLVEAATKLYPELESDKHQQLALAYREQYVAMHQGPNPLFERVRETLETLVDAEYLLAVATAKSRRGLNRDFHGWDLEKYFTCSRCVEETASKPDPRMLFEILDELAIDKQHSLMIGDSEYDLQMANEAGMDCVLAEYGAEREHLSVYQPIDRISAFAELPALLERL